MKTSEYALNQYYRRLIDLSTDLFLKIKEEKDNQGKDTYIPLMTKEIDAQHISNMEKDMKGLETQMFQVCKMLNAAKLDRLRQMKPSRTYDTPRKQEAVYAVPGAIESTYAAPVKKPQYAAVKTKVQENQYVVIKDKDDIQYSQIAHIRKFGAR